MKKALFATVALSILATTAAYAQPAHGNYDRQRQPGSWSEKHSSYWTKGQRLPENYRSNTVDYRRHRLSAPPHGYRWVQADDQYLLIGIATGLISTIIAGH